MSSYLWAGAVSSTKVTSEFSSVKLLKPEIGVFHFRDTSGSLLGLLGADSLSVGSP